MKTKRLSRTAATATRFPHLFRATYWGAFKVGRDAETITPEVVENRNRFARQWRLRRNAGGVRPYPQRGQGYDFDHAELYKDAEGWLVLVCSNYGATPPPVVLGMVKIAPLYCTGAESYAGRYATRRELRARLKACAGDRRPFAPGLHPAGAEHGAGACGASRGQPGP